MDNNAHAFFLKKVSDSIRGKNGICLKKGVDNGFGKLDLKGI